MNVRARHRAGSSFSKSRTRIRGMNHTSSIARCIENAVFSSCDEQWYQRLQTIGLLDCGKLDWRGRARSRWSVAEGLSDVLECHNNDADHDRRERHERSHDALDIADRSSVSCSRCEECDLTVTVDERDLLCFEPRSPRGVEMRSQGHSLTSANRLQFDACTKQGASGDVASAVRHHDVARIGRLELVM